MIPIPVRGSPLPVRSPGSTTRRSGRRWALLLLATLAGCAGVEPLPDDHYYRLVAGPPPARLAEPALLGRLVVEMPSAAGVRRNREILYSPAPHVRFQQYHYHHWEESPTELLRHRIVDALRAANVAPAVTDQGGGAVQFRLQSHLARFERLVDGEHFTALVEVHVRLFALADPAAPLLVADYVIEQPAEGSSMEATALAFARAVDRFLAALVEDIAR